MADLSTLVRLHKHEIDEKRREIKDLYDKLDKIQENKSLVLNELEQEKDAILNSEDTVHFTYSDFQEKSKQECLELDCKINILEQQIFLARDEMLDIFNEMKRYDIANKERIRIEKEEQRLRDSKTLDEIALETFRRKTDR